MNLDKPEDFRRAQEAIKAYLLQHVTSSRLEADHAAFRMANMINRRATVSELSDELSQWSFERGRFDDGSAILKAARQSKGRRR